MLCFAERGIVVLNSAFLLSNQFRIAQTYFSLLKITLNVALLF